MFSGIHFLVVKPGIRRYSPKVLETSFKKIAISHEIYGEKNFANVVNFMRVSDIKNVFFKELRLIKQTILYQQEFCNRIL